MWARVTGKPPAEPKEDEKEACDWETVRANECASRTIATWGGGAYHWSREFCDELKAEGDSWGEKRIASERSTRETMMAGGASPPRRASSVNTSFLDEIDDPHGDYGRMGKMESSSYSPKGYTKSDMSKIRNLTDEEHARQRRRLHLRGWNRNKLPGKEKVRQERAK
jgi:hypothetical protein